MITLSDKDRAYAQAIAEAEREYVRGLREWTPGVQPYPAAAGDALIAAMEAKQIPEV